MGFKNNFTLHILLGIFCGGIFFLNCFNTHGWGDDFALYLMQAEKTAQFSFQKNTFYVFNPLNSAISPPYYPPVYPAFLSIFHACFNNETAGYILLNHFLLVALAFVLFRYLKHNENDLPAFLFCLLLLYNPWVLHFKNEILSEFLFTMLLVLLAICYRQKNPNTINIIILCSLLISTRSIGWIALPALLIALLHKYGWKQLLIVSISVTLLSSLLNLVFIGELFSTGYVFNLKQESLFSTVCTNFTFYKNVFGTFFIPYLETKKILIPFSKFITCSLFATGIAYSFLKQKYLFESAFTLIYLSVLLIYPHHSSGFRYLFPVVPFVFLFMIVALRFLSKMFPFVLMQRTVMYAIPLFLLLQYQPNISYILKESNAIIDSPNSSDAVEMFSAVKHITTINDTVYFARPKALGYYAARYAKALPETNQEKIKYFIHDSRYSDLDTIVTGNKFDTVWHNNRFVLFKRTSAKSASL